MERMTTRVGHNIAFLRKKHGFTQGQLAKMLRLKGKSGVCAYEKGFADPPIMALIRLGKIFNVTIDDLLTKTFKDRPININKSNMPEIKNPKLISEVIPGASYSVPTYKVTNEGLADGQGIAIEFCKGNKEDESVFRQEGVFTETLLQTAKQYLEAVNVGELANREASMAITKIDEALMWLGKRAEDRKLRGVQGTYKK